MSMGAKAVLIKGGHFDVNTNKRTDWLVNENGIKEFHQTNVETPNTHGTGCTLSAAIAAYLGHGMSLDLAITKAQVYLNTALRKSFTPGMGLGSPCFKI